ncbi:hypothetical protein DFJ43DRAFT_1154175 [Lentinula guzmanii]|uniref:Uncharacterized protein n=1 Tax=Lentinula guzmanii TaxID=2804957 RepID=A0AA38N1Q5_9AGAR|nr:hypothetical protein DFJ43DRAFT_1154175 [Lentinula guzmanii]
MSSKEEMQTISDMLCQTYSSVAALDPPPPDASQETQEAFNNMLRTAQQASGQILSLVVGLGQSATDTNGQPLDLHLGNGQWGDDLLLNNQPFSNSTDRDQDSGNEPLDAQIEQDIEELLSFANDPQAWLTLLDFRLMIEKGEHDGTTAQKEKEAFRRMLVGYKCISTDEIYDNFTSHDFKLATVSIRHHARTVRSFHTMPVTEERLFEREKLLFNPSSSTVVHAWVNTVINNIEAIEAAKDWMGEGTEWRTNFRRALAEHFYKDEFERINNSLFASTQKEKLSKKLYRRFSKKHDKIIARRKQMLRLFELVPYPSPTLLIYALNSPPVWTNYP